MTSHRPLGITMTTIVCLTACLASACSARYDFTECTDDATCAQYNVPGTIYRCQESVCVGSPVMDEQPECVMDTDCPGDAARARCVNQACTLLPEPVMTDMGDPTDMRDMTPVDEPDMMVVDVPDMPDMMAPECTKTSACIADRGPTYVCVEGTCQNALDAAGDCQRVYYGSTVNPDNVVYIGTLLPLVEPFGTIIGKPLENAVQLAIDEVNDNGGLAGGRKIAWISCDSKGNAQIAQRATTHLTTLPVPAVVGPLFSEAFITSVSNVTNAAGMFAITPTATSPAIARQRQGKNLVWRNIASDTFQAYAFWRRIQDLGATNILIAFKDDIYGDDLQNELSDLLVNDTATTYTIEKVKLPNPIERAGVSQQDLSMEYGGLIAQKIDAAGFVPQVVVIVGTNEGALATGAYLSVASAKSVPPGKIIISHGVIPAMPTLAASLEATAGPQAVALVEGIAPDIYDPDSPSYAKYKERYNLSFGGAEPALASTTTFDAVMTTVLAMAPIKADEEVTGQKIADNIAKLVDKDGGQVITLYRGTSFFNDAAGALANGDTIDLVGVSGQLDYDLETGEIYSPFIGWGVEKNAAGNYEIVQRRVMTFDDAPALTGASWADKNPMP